MDLTDFLNDFYEGINSLFNPYKDRLLYAGNFRDSQKETGEDARYEHIFLMGNRHNGKGKGGESRKHPRGGLELTGNDGTRYHITRKGKRTLIIRYAGFTETLTSTDKDKTFCDILKQWASNKNISGNRIKDTLKNYRNNN